MKFIRFLFLLFAFLFCSLPAFGQDANDLELKIDIDQTHKYLLYEPVLVRCYLINNSDHDIVLPYIRFDDEQTGNFHFSIIDSKGIEITKHPRMGDHDRPDGMVIKAKSIFSDLFNLLDYYDISAPDNYSLKVIYESDGKYLKINPKSGVEIKKDGWKGKLSVDIGKITVAKPRKQDDIDVLDSVAFVPDDPNFKFTYIFYDEKKREKIIEKFPKSVYADIARYCDAIRKFYSFGEQEVRNKHNGYIIEAYDQLCKIDTSNFSSLFKEDVMFRIVQTSKYLEKENAGKMLDEFKKKYPKSPFIMELNKLFGIEEPEKQQAAEKDKKKADGTNKPEQGVSLLLMSGIIVGVLLVIVFGFRIFRKNVT